MKLLIPLAGYTFYDHKTNDSICRKLQTECILDKLDEYRRTLAFTLAKNATKPNSFEIISLQTTRKENNWKTEETLARAVVTLGDGTDQMGPILDVYVDDDILITCEPDVVLYRA
jgi:hypothetical protein